MKRRIAITMGEPGGVGPEIIMKALKKGYRVSEVPTHENRRVAGYSKIKIRKVFLRYGYVLMRDIFLG